MTGIRLWLRHLRRVRAFNAPVGGACTVSWVEGDLQRGRVFREGLGSSSEEGTRLRRRQALEQGVNSPEGTPGPRARWRFRGATPGPRVTRRFTRGVPVASCLLGHSGFLGRGPFSAFGRGHAWCDSRLVGLFVHFY
jgi:hypothetical protein